MRLIEVHITVSPEIQADFHYIEIYIQWPIRVGKGHITSLPYFTLRCQKTLTQCLVRNKSYISAIYSTYSVCYGEPKRETVIQS